MTNRMALAQFVERAEFLRTPVQKQIVLGTGIRSVKDGMYISIGRKFDAFCPTSEIGDAVVVEATLFFVLSANNEETVPTVSRVRAAMWEELAGMKQDGDTAFVKVTKVARNRKNQVTGVNATFIEGRAKGVSGFVSTESLRGADPDKLVGQVLAVAVTNLNPYKGGNDGNGSIMLNHSRVFGKNTTEAVASIAVGEQLTGRVLKFIYASEADEHPSVLVSVEKEGVFVEGMIHKAEVTGYPQQKATDILKVGDKISARVLRASTAKRTIALGLRADERAQFLAGIEPGCIVTGKVARATNFGYFIDLGRGIEGLLRTHQLLRSHGQNETFAKGEEIAVIILENDEQKGKLLFSRRGLKPEFLKKA